MLSVLEPLKKFITLRKVKISNFVFRLHYKLTVLIVLAFSILVTTKQYIGDPIDCMVDEIPLDVMDAYCWIYSTFTIPNSLNERVGVDVIHPGVRPYVPGEEETKYHQYYQWVCFVLFFQAILCYTPHYLWKSWEGGRLNKLILDLNNPVQIYDCVDDLCHEDDICEHLKNAPEDGELQRWFRKRYPELQHKKKLNTLALEALRQAQGNTNLSDVLLRHIDAPYSYRISSRDLSEMANSIRNLNSQQLNKGIISEGDIAELEGTNPNHVSRSIFRSINKTLVDIYVHLDDQRAFDRSTLEEVYEAHVQENDRIVADYKDELKYFKDYDRLIEKLCGLMKKITETERSSIHIIADYFSINNGSHKWYMFRFVFCEILNFINIVGQLFLMDFFLSGEFSSYGWDVLSFLNVSPDQRIDPMAQVFPKVTKCTFNKYGPSGTVQKFDGLCVLPVNIINEKLYVFLWFWFVFLSVLTGIWLIYRLILTLIKSVQVKELFVPIFSDQDKNHVKQLRDYDFDVADWFIFNQLRTNIDPFAYRQLVRCMYNIYHPRNYSKNFMLTKILLSKNFMPVSIENVRQRKYVLKQDVENGLFLSDPEYDVSKLLKYL